MLFVSLPPRGWWWAGVAGVGLFAFAVRDVGWRRRLALGYVTGLAWFGPALAWVAGFSLPGVVLLVALQVSFVGLAAALVLRGRVVLVPVVLAVSEWLRST